MYKADNLSTKLAARNILNANYIDKRILIRSCLNVSLDKSSNITDSTRIDEALPTLIELGKKAKQVIIMAHLGRPSVAREKEFSLKPVRNALEKGLKEKVVMIKEDLRLDHVSDKFVLIENIRFFPGEESKDISKRENFAKQLSLLGDLYVNDAFPDYREASSTYDIAKYLPSFLGPVFIREVEAISRFTNPQRPFIVILGGAKLSEKLDALNTLAGIADRILIGGAMAYTLLIGDGMDKVGKSLVEPDKFGVAREIMSKYKEKIILPVDHVVVASFSQESEVSITSDVSIPTNQIAVDIGPKTQKLFIKEISRAKSILWNGPLGVFEWDNSFEGTQAVAKAIGKNRDAYSFAGGGDSIAAINKFSINGLDHISTGGGAMLAFIGNDNFPTLDIILNN